MNTQITFDFRGVVVDDAVSLSAPTTSIFTQVPNSLYWLGRLYAAKADIRFTDSMYKDQIVIYLQAHKVCSIASIGQELISPDYIATSDICILRNNPYVPRTPLEPIKANLGREPYVDWNTLGSDLLDIVNHRRRG